MGLHELFQTVQWGGPYLDDMPHRQRSNRGQCSFCMMAAGGGKFLHCKCRQRHASKHTDRYS